MGGGDQCDDYAFFKLNRMKKRRYRHQEDDDDEDAEDARHNLFGSRCLFLLLLLLLMSSSFIFLTMEPVGLKHPCDCLVVMVRVVNPATPPYRLPLLWSVGNYQISIM